MDQKIKAELIVKAISARKNSYAPYSKYQVGAAILTGDGKIFTGCNVENVAYGEAICAERAAIVKAISEGQRKFLGIAVATENAATPCGSCRQVLAEFNLQMEIISVDKDQKLKEFLLSDLLPQYFGPEHLKV